MLESGDYGTLAELAEAERISRSYICRVLRLTLLVPDIVERILDGRPTAGLGQLLQPFSVEWEKQRQEFSYGGLRRLRLAAADDSQAASISARPGRQPKN